MNRPFSKMEPAERGLETGGMAWDGTKVSTKDGKFSDDKHCKMRRKLAEKEGKEERRRILS